MSKQGVDYSWARPGGATLKAAGKDFAVRYIPYPGSNGKGIEADEIADLRANDVLIAINYESWADRALSGFDGGVADATESQKQLIRVGLDQNMPIYFAVDFDASEDQQGVIDDYLRGAASVIGVERVGVYAGYWVVKRCWENGTAKFLWQTYAWSGGNVHPEVHLYQYLNGQDINGAVDLCEARKENFGQEYSAPLPTPAPDVPETSTPTYTVESGDYLILIGEKTGVDWHYIAHLNNITAPYTIYPGQILLLGDGPISPAPAGNTYTVQSGDTFWDLEEANGWTHGVLQGMNPDVDPRNIQVGQVIVTP